MANMAEVVGRACSTVEDSFFDALERPFPIKGRKTKVRNILVAFIAVGGYDLDRDSEGALAAFNGYCAACAKDFGRWASACADNWIGFLDNRERMRTWQRKKDQVPEIAGKKTKETYSC